MGTRFNLLLPGVDKPEGNRLFFSCLQELNRLENILSCFIPSSEVSFINKNAFINTVNLNQELFDILLECKKFYNITLGLFDISIGKVVDYWKDGYQSDKTNKIFKDVGMDAIVIDPEKRSIRFTSPDIKLNFGGYGKGYALSQVLYILKNHKVESAFLSFGESSVACIGKHPHGDYWPVGVQDFYVKSKVIKTFHLVDYAVSTSGNLDQENHIINPLLKKPLQEKTMVSVKASTPELAEIISTACILANEKQIANILQQISNLEVVKLKYTNETFVKKEYNS